MNKKRTLMEIFLVIIIIILFTSFVFFQFHRIKSSIRNNIRKGNVADIQKALLFYHNSVHDYPISEGECIDQDGSVTQKLEDIKLVNEIPTDPVWPSTQPSSVDEKGEPSESSANFCFWYVSNGRGYTIFYYLEPSNETQKQGMASTTEKAIR